MVSSPVNLFFYQRPHIHTQIYTEPLAKWLAGAVNFTVSKSRRYQLAIPVTGKYEGNSPLEYSVWIFGFDGDFWANHLIVLKNVQKRRVTVKNYERRRSSWSAVRAIIPNIKCAITLAGPRTRMFLPPNSSLSRPFTLSTLERSL